MNVILIRCYTFGLLPQGAAHGMNACHSGGECQGLETAIAHKKESATATAQRSIDLRNYLASSALFQYSESALFFRVSFCTNFSATAVKMQNNASSVEFQAFKKSTSADSNNSLQRRGSKGQSEHLLQQCVSNLPHAGSVGSIVSRLPFSTVAVCHQDTVGIVRLVGLFDSVIPDATKQRISKAGFCKRILLISVRTNRHFALRCASARLDSFSPAIQAWIFWILILAFALQMIVSSIQSAVWIQKQPVRSSQGTSYHVLTQVSVIWTSEQVVNMALFPMLNLRKFNG